MTKAGQIAGLISAGLDFRYSPSFENLAASPKASVGTERENVLNVVFTTRHMDVSPAFKAYAEEKASKLTKYYDRIQEIEVIVDMVEKSTKTLEVEVIVNGEKKNLFIAKHQGTDPNKCVDACVRTLERQLSDHHKKVKNRKHPA